MPSGGRKARVGRRNPSRSRPSRTPSPRATHASLDSSCIPRPARTAAADSPPLQGSRPADFAMPRGSAVRNMSTILQDVDKQLGVSSPPDIEYIFTEHVQTVGRFGAGLAKFGHALIRYTLPADCTLDVPWHPDVAHLAPPPGQPRQVIMNIVGLEGRDMVNFIPANEYLFGTSGFDGPSQQGGVYNRAFCGVRIEKVRPGVVEALHQFYLSVACLQRIHNSRFQLVGGKARAWFRRYAPFSEDAVTTGNCAYWTSGGLEWVGLLKRRRIMPKAIWFDLLEAQHERDPENVHVVYYHNLPACHQLYGETILHSSAFVGITQVVRNWYYWRLHPFADVHVRGAAGSDVVVAERKLGNSLPCRPPSWMRWWHTYWVMILVVTFIATAPHYHVAFSLDRMEVRLVLSALFIVLNYWLY